MKKSLFTLMFLFLASSAFAASFSGNFPIQVTLPAATTVNFIVSEVIPGATPTFLPHTGNFMNFDTAGLGMKYLTGPGIWVGDHFFAIDVSPSNAVGDSAPANFGSISFQYSSQVVPSGQLLTEGLNKRATLTAVKVVGPIGSQTETTLRAAAALGDPVVNLANSDVQGGFLRVYVGTYTGSPAITGAVPFTNADKPGVYTGTLTVTATLI